MCLNNFGLRRIIHIVGHMVLKKYVLVMKRTTAPRTHLIQHRFQFDPQQPQTLNRKSDSTRLSLCCYNYASACGPNMAAALWAFRAEYYVSRYNWLKLLGWLAAGTVFFSSLFLSLFFFFFSTWYAHNVLASLRLQSRQVYQLCKLTGATQGSRNRSAPPTSKGAPSAWNTKVYDPR